MRIEAAKGLKRLLPRVFGRKEARKGTEPPSDDFTVDGMLWRGAQNTPRDKKYKAFTKAPVEGIVSDMKVIEWLQTPWHYEYLPFQPMNSVFKDGETYCNGCTRCSRRQTGGSTWSSRC